jgi:hypothetical protein
MCYRKSPESQEIVVVARPVIVGLDPAKVAIGLVSMGGRTTGMGTMGVE